MKAEEIRNMTPGELIWAGGFDCECGKHHCAGTKRIIIEQGAVNRLPDLIKECGAKKVFLLSGHDTFAAAGEKVCSFLSGAGIPYSKYVFPISPVMPTEHSVGSAVMHFDFGCDLIVGVGSGVINDIGKIIAHATGRPYIIVATAPSMDGYASATSSMERDGLKISLDSVSPWAIVGDVDILREAPMRSLQAGVGDILAKYISLAEWKIANILIDEYYCPAVAAMVENALKKVVDSAPGLLRREPEAVKAVMDGLVISGIAMKYVDLSRPASGTEHYFSHIWDMRALAFDDAKSELHGIQCGIGTLYALKVYEYISRIRPDADKGLSYVRGFSSDDWNRSLRKFIGPGAEAMIAAEKREGKYDLGKHSNRVNRIPGKWDKILEVIKGLPPYEDVYSLIKSIGAPVSAAELGYSKEQIRTTFKMTKDVRDKYIASRLLWDLGLLDDAADSVFK